LAFEVVALAEGVLVVVDFFGAEVVLLVPPEGLAAAVLGVFFAGAALVVAVLALFGFAAALGLGAGLFWCSR
jgi:hypothetical protein